MSSNKKSRSAGSRIRVLFIILLAAAVGLCALIFLTGERQKAPVASSTDLPFVITEIMPDNDSALKDDAGNYSDWIELYNASNTEASLDGYYLSDSGSQPLKWALPPVKVPPREYMIIWCSGEDKYDSVSGNMHTNFRLSSSGETVLLSKPSAVYSVSVTYGEALPDISYGLIQPEGSDELQYKWLDTPTPGKPNTGVYADSAFMIPSAEISGVVINELQTHNNHTIYDAAGDYYDWVELYNSTDEDVDLSGCVLTDRETDVKRWTIPEGTLIHKKSYLLVFLTGANGTDVKDGEDVVYAPFSLGDSDTELVLYDSRAKLIDRVDIPPLADDVSYGRDSGGEWLYYTLPTPGRDNASRGFAELSSAMSIEGQLYISEVCAAAKRYNTMSQPDWIELCNGSENDIDLEGYGLGRSADALREFVFGPGTLKPGGYIVVNAAGEKSSDKKQAPFKLSSSGSTIYLTDPNGAVIDVFRTGKLGLGITSGRKSTSSPDRCFFLSETPGADNTAQSYNGYAPKPEILSDGGYVDKGCKVKISVPDGTVVRYTTDGSEPDEQSEIYQSPIEVTGSMTVKAASFADGMIRSDCDFVTFIADTKSSLPVVCISGDPNGLLGSTIGIYDINSSIYNDVSIRATYDWEREVNIEYFDDNTRALEFTAGLRLYGSGSKYYNQRSFAVLLRDIYGQSEVTYPFFKDCPRITAKGLVLRAGGQDQFYTFLRDGFCGRMAQKYSPNIVSTCCQPVSVYINGRYWGTYELREKVNEDYFELNYGINKKNLDIIQHNYIVNSGSYSEYGDLLDYMRKHDVNDSEVYDYLCGKIDMDSAADYVIFEHFFKNIDYGNVRLYLDRDGGKWRWILFDMDMCMREGSDKPNFSATSNIFMQDLYIDRLCDSAQFRDLLLRRYAELLDTGFRPEELLKVLDDMAAEIEPEVQHSYERWGHLDYKAWSNQMDKLRERLKARPEVVKSELKRYFRLSNEEYDLYFGEGKDAGDGR